MEMTKISGCNAIGCVYNKGNVCHTMAVNVGDELPVCDTYMASEVKAGFQEVEGGIGSCKVTSCSYNKSLECTSSSVNMAIVENHVDCMTYKKR